MSKKLTQISSLFGFKSKVSSRTQSDLMKQAGKFQVLAGPASKATRGMGDIYLEGAQRGRHLDRITS